MRQSQTTVLFPQSSSLCPASYARSSTPQQAQALNLLSQIVTVSWCRFPPFTLICSDICIYFRPAFSQKKLHTHVQKVIRTDSPLAFWTFVSHTNEQQSMLTFSQNFLGESRTNNRVLTNRSLFPCLAQPRGRAFENFDLSFFRLFLPYHIFPFSFPPVFGSRLFFWVTPCSRH